MNILEFTSQQGPQPSIRTQPETPKHSPRSIASCRTSKTLPRWLHRLVSRCLRLPTGGPVALADNLFNAVLDELDTHQRRLKQLPDRTTRQLVAPRQPVARRRDFSQPPFEQRAAAMIDTLVAENMRLNAENTQLRRVLAAVQPDLDLVRSGRR